MILTESKLRERDEEDTLWNSEIKDEEEPCGKPQGAVAKGCD